MSGKTEKIIEDIRKKAAIIDRPLRFMELCGTHAETIAKHAIKEVLPKNIKLVSGPGCPVCVTDESDIDAVVGLAKAGIPIACYGDAAGIPGNLGSLEGARREGAKVYIVYDVAEAIRIQKKEPELVFWGLGFETTAPMTAWAIKKGLVVYSSHKLFPPAMEALLSNKNIRVDGFINPGHVSAIIGTKVYEQFKIPQVVAGFGAMDVLDAVDRLLAQIIKKETNVENAYGRLVKKDGNKKAQAFINNVFEVRDSDWRGLGKIRNAGLKIRKKYQKQDAEYIYRDIMAKIRKDKKPKKSACRCGEVLQGFIEPTDCPLFSRFCTPDSPKGACMVSQEGACNIEYRFAK
jgi:hydrogenase expression/formation protein HypD